MTKQIKDIDYESIQKKALEQFSSGKSLLGKDGVFAPLFKQFLEAALAAEMEGGMKLFFLSGSAVKLVLNFENVLIRDIT